jgi:hypothetical protein
MKSPLNSLSLLNFKETALADKLEIGQQKWIPKEKDEALMVRQKLIFTSLRRFVVLKKNSFETGYL